MLAQGSTYTPLSPGDLALPFTEGVATFTGGDLYTNDANGLTKIWDFSKVQYSASTRAFKQPGFGFHGSAPESVSLKIIPGNGQISGSFIDPITGQQALIKGVLLQEQGSALGYFLNANGSGYFALEPVQP